MKIYAFECHSCVFKIECSVAQMCLVTVFEIALVKYYIFLFYAFYKQNKRDVNLDRALLDICL